MKKVVIILASLAIVAAVATAIIMNVTKPKTENGTNNTSSANTASNAVSNTTQETEGKEGYNVEVSKKEITMKKNTRDSFVVTFTTPDESSIREYIYCKDQNNIILVSYGNVIDKKITVGVDALKVGTTEITVKDYENPNKKEIVKITVTE